MKGTQDAPQCGFSRAAVQVLGIQGVPAEKLQTYNVLADEELRQGIKEFSYVLIMTCFIRESDVSVYVESGRLFHKFM